MREQFFPYGIGENPSNALVSIFGENQPVARYSRFTWRLAYQQTSLNQLGNRLLK